MPRQPRLDTPGALHHVMGRGIDGITIFGSRKDCEDFLGRLQDVVRCRKIVCQIAIKKMGYSGAHVARFLCITTSGVNRLAASDVLSDTEKYH
jgi:hypothetical protein